ncbi:T6SS effector BTH_I2691 family protein [Iodobacter sp.]|uniref:T6SS effector BTH_I2691 family protein n=1 Tax=Iodobacter sp. TaxID=1915058 RepID=UPI0025E4FB29|nr:T6SS effector BTH_I2691 family protein [Iodobacter sp.]
MSQLCKACQASGLPIMPVRYAVVPTSVAAKLPAWAEGTRVKDIALGSDFHYALRTLRAGYVYLFYSKNARGAKQWECYTVTEDGLLLLQPTPKAASAPKDSITCQTAGHSNSRLHHLIIDRPDDCGPTWIAFSEHKWSDETLAQYGSDAKLRSARMQAIDPKAMAAGAKNPHSSPASQAALESIMEYSPGFSSAQLPYDQKVPEFSKDDGSFSEKKLAMVSTLYRVCSRKGATADTLQFMQVRAKKSAGGSNTPQIMALWDAIGTVNELNGFRSDPAGLMKQFTTERELELSTLSSIEGLKKALSNKAGSEAEAEARHFPGKRAGSLENYPDLTRRKIAANVQFNDDHNQAKLNKELAAIEAERAKRDAPAKEAEDRRANSEQSQHYKKLKMAHSWDKYSTKIDPNVFNTFNNNLESLLSKADALIEQRTTLLLKWLDAPLFIDTLEDFHPSNIKDGVQFEEVISHAILGMGTSKSGKAKIDAWIMEGKASVKSNLLWRAFALNQKEAIPEIDKLLLEAKAGSNIVLTPVAWASVVANIKWNKIADLYKKAQTFENTNLRAAGSKGAMKEAKLFGFLGIFATTGDRLLSHSFAAKMIDSVVKEKVFQSLFLLRAGAHVDAVLDLVKEQALRENLDRKAMLSRIQTAEVFANAMEDGGKLRPNAAVLQEKWSKLAENADVPGKDKRFNAAKDARLAMVVAMLEAFNLAKCSYSAKADSKSMITIAAGVASLASAATDVYANVVKGALEESSYTFQRLKFFGGMLSGIASLAGVATSWMDADKYGSAKKVNLYYLAMSNVIFGGLAGIFNLLSTLSYCGPWLAAAVERQALQNAAKASVTKLAAAAAKRLLMYRAILMGLGLTFNIVALGIQLLIWQLTDNELQEWCEKCAFGLKRDPNWTLKTQNKMLYKATYAVGV